MDQWRRKLNICWNTKKSVLRKGIFPPFLWTNLLRCLMCTWLDSLIFLFFSNQCWRWKSLGHSMISKVPEIPPSLYQLGQNCYGKCSTTMGNLLPLHHPLEVDDIISCYWIVLVGNVLFSTVDKFIKAHQCSHFSTSWSMVTVPDLTIRQLWLICSVSVVLIRPFSVISIDCLCVYSCSVSL